MKIRNSMALALLVAFVVTVAMPADVLAKKRSITNQVTAIDKDEARAEKKAERRAARREARQAKRQVERAAVLAKSQTEDELVAMMDEINAALAADGADYRAYMAEYVTDLAGSDGSNTVIASDVGNKRLSFDFVPFDSRRGWGDPAGGITYAIDTTGDAVPFAGGLTGAQTDAAISRAHGTWEALPCSALNQSRNPDFGLDIGVVAFQLSGGAVGSPFAFADVQHAGWRDLEFGGGTLGVTFTFGFIDVSQLPAIVFTDIDNNKRGDTSIREIYYDPISSTGAPRIWTDDGVSNFDVETVALHEIGHGLSQAHFGKVFLDNKGNLKFAPKAVMNAVYVAPQRTLLGTDNGGHCANWGNWPQN